MLAYLNNETGGEAIRNYVENGDEIYAHAINLCEVFYDFLRTSPVAEAEAAIATLKTDGILERNDMDAACWRDVATLIATRRAQPAHPSKPSEKPRLALGDACGLALARRLNADFVTSDRGEIEPIQKAGLANVIFIRCLNSV